MKTIADVTLSELMGEDYTLWITKNKKFGFDISIETDFDGNEIVNEKGIHPYAMESFAQFCRSFIRYFDRLENN